MMIKVGNSQVSLEVFNTYLGAIVLSNQRAAQFVERRLILDALTPANMPAQIIGNMRVVELAALHPAVAEAAFRALSQRLAQIERAEKAVI